MADVVLDASAGVELLANSQTGQRLASLVRPGTVFWVPDGVFDVEVSSVFRRWDLGGMVDRPLISESRQELKRARLRRVSVRALAERAWTFRANITFADACYVALAEALGCSLLTTDLRLVGSPNLPIPTLHP